jgi:hypothetical protein
MTNKKDEIVTRPSTGRYSIKDSQTLPQNESPESKLHTFQEFKHEKNNLKHIFIESATKTDNFIFLGHMSNLNDLSKCYYVTKMDENKYNTIQRNLSLHGKGFQIVNTK